MSTLRILDNGNISNLIVCEDADFQSALAIVKVLLQHTAKVFQTLQPIATNTPTEKTQIRQQYFEALPAEFNRQTYLAAAQHLGIPPKTAEKYIANLCSNGELIHVKHGKYCKPK